MAFPPVWTNSACKLIFPSSVLLHFPLLFVEYGDALHLVSVGSQVPLGPNWSHSCKSSTLSMCCPVRHFLGWSFIVVELSCFCMFVCCCCFVVVFFFFFCCCCCCCCYCCCFPVDSLVCFHVVILYWPYIQVSFAMFTSVLIFLVISLYMYNLWLGQKGLNHGWGNEDQYILKAMPLKLLNIKYKIFANVTDLSSSGHKPLTLTVHRAIGAKEIDVPLRSWIRT